MADIDPLWGAPKVKEKLPKPGFVIFEPIIVWLAARTQQETAIANLANLCQESQAGYDRRGLFRRAHDQVLETLTAHPAPKYLLRDRDRTYGDRYRHGVRNLGIDEVLTSP